eukprot:5760375-Amphidinium_carterae.1
MKTHLNDLSVGISKFRDVQFVVPRASKRQSQSTFLGYGEHCPLCVIPCHYSMFPLCVVAVRMVLGACCCWKDEVTFK